MQFNLQKSKTLLAVYKIRSMLFAHFCSTEKFAKQNASPNTSYFRKFLSPGSLRLNAERVPWRGTKNAQKQDSRARTSAIKTQIISAEKQCCEIQAV
jgi:hypothetical protein